jgi:hypothetical protein
MEKPGCVGLLAAVGYMEDLEVTATLADRLRARGCITHLAHPRQVRRAGDGVLHLDSAWYRGPMNAVLRFFQGEWLGELPMDGAWPLFFRGGRTPVCNPGSGLLVESKRFPLIWERLGTTLPTWRALLPPTRDPRTVNWRRDDRWLLKTAFCNTGDTVTMRGLTADRHWMRAVDASLRPGRWVAQERFAALVLETPAGPRYPCLGVYTVNGTTAGVYGRLAERPLINYTATDVAVLVEATRPVHG